MGRRKSRRKRKRGKSKRSYAARKGWDTRTRREGYRQIAKAVVGVYDPVGKVQFVKNVSIAALKIANPRFYRKSRVLKKLDKAI